MVTLYILNTQPLFSLSEGLSNVGQQLGDSDLNVWKYNEQTCLDWLLQKVGGWTNDFYSIFIFFTMLFYHSFS